MKGVSCSANQVGSAFLAGFFAAIVVDGLARGRKARAAGEPGALIVRASSMQVPVTHIAGPVERFVRERAVRCARGASIGSALLEQGPGGSRIYAFARDTGKRVGAGGIDTGSESLTSREVARWKECAESGGEWCAYLEDAGGGALGCEYVFVAPAGNVFFSSGIRVGR